MENLWGDFNGIENFKTPKEILQIQASFISQMTHGVLYGEVIQDGLHDSNVNRANFEFKLIIKSEFLRNYSYDVVSIKHEISQYPVEISFHDNIFDELNTEEVLKYKHNIWNSYDELVGVYAKVNDENDFLYILGKVLKSNHIKNVITALYNMAK